MWSRWSWVALAAFVSSSAACSAELTPLCVGGVCDDDTGIPTSSSSTGAGGSGGGGVSCFAPTDTIDACDVTLMPTAGDIPCDVWAVMHRDPIDAGGCHTCHQMPPKMAAPFPEISYEALLAKSNSNPDNVDELIFQTMLKAIQPDAETRFHISHMPFGDAPPLTCDESLTLSNWLRGDGTPGGCAKPVATGMGDGACCAQLGQPSLPAAGCP